MSMLIGPGHGESLLLVLLEHTKLLLLLFWPSLPSHHPNNAESRKGKESTKIIKQTTINTISIPWPG